MKITTGLGLSTSHIFLTLYLLVGVKQHIGAIHAKIIANSMSSKNSTLSNLEDFFSMMNENVSLLSETTSVQ